MINEKEKGKCKYVFPNWLWEYGEKSNVVKYFITEKDNYIYF